jgi:NADH-quinone oxidoreductase subunit H
MVTAAFLIVIMFLGGWHFWGITGSTQEVTWLGAFLRFGILSAKIFAVILFFMVVRWSWPRFRFDQLMNLAWKVMLPLGLLNLVVVATIEEFRTTLEFTLGTGLAAFFTIGGPWLIFFGGWICAGLLTPSATDNRPIRTPNSFTQKQNLQNSSVKKQSPDLVEV